MLFFVVLILLTFFGDKVYYALHTEVESYKVGGVYSFNEEEYYRLPVSSISYENGSAFVYVIVTTEGFSMKLYNIEKREVLFSTPPDIDIPETYTYASTGVRPSESIVKVSGDNLTDGQRVVIKK